MFESLFNWRFALKSLLWGAAMLAVLQLRHVSGNWSHALCGPWGCGPTLEAVLTCHAAWIVMLTPAVLLIARHASRETANIVGRTMMGLGLLGLVGVGVWLVVTWFPHASSLLRSYCVQKYLYTVACLVDLPMVQLLLAGGGLVLGSRREALSAADARHKSRGSTAVPIDANHPEDERS